MDSHDTRGVTRSPKGPTATSVLGIKGQLRFRPHGSTQKAHVVLRQVDWSSEDPEEEVDPSMVYFSLFAQKRIEVKPGKEILLAVATPDGTFMDMPVIFAGRLTEEDADLDDAVVKSVELDPNAIPPHCTLPPKMRKTWSKRSTVQNGPQPVTPQIYASVGVQTTLPITPPETEDSSPEEEGEEDNVSSLRERSLSPMELDSAPSSPPPSSPVVLPEAAPPLAAGTKSASFSPPGLWVATSPQPPPVVLQTDIPSLDLSSSKDDSLEGLSPATLPELPRPISPVRSLPDATEGAEKITVPQLNNTPTALPPSPTGTVAVPPPHVSPPSTPAADEAKPVAISVASVVLPAAPYVPKRKIVPNPFVSGGLLTDFVSSSAAKKVVNAPQEVQGNSDRISSPDEIPGLSKSLAAPPLSADSSVVASPQTNDREADGSPMRVSPPSPVCMSPVRRSPSPMSSASPSSSKVKVEDILPPPPPPPLPPLPTPSSQALPANQMAYDPLRPDLQLHLNPPRFPPPMAMPNFPPNLVRPSLPPPPPPPQPHWTNGHVPPPPPPPPPPASKGYSSAPDLKSSAYVPTTSYSNPLGIRPAAPTGTWKHDRYGQPTHPQSATTASTAPKKPLHIGSGWPHNKQTNGHTGRGSQRPSMKAPAFVGATHSVPSVPQPQSIPSTNGATSISTSNGTPHSPLTIKHDAQGTEADPPYSPALPAMNGSGIPIPSLQKNGYEKPAVTSTPTIPIHTPTPTFVPASATIARLPATTPTTSHPLPVKPSTYTGTPGNWSPSMGVKRMGSPGLQSQSPDSRRARNFNWPTSEAIYLLRLTSDSGDPGIRMISHNSDGSLCAAICFDKSVRILSTKTRTELARLAHNMQVTAVAWMERDAGVITLGQNGIVSTWTRSAGNKWQWAKILDASAGKTDGEPGCLAFGRDRIAISYPRTGVKVWLFIKGTWLPQRSILRQNVTAIKFVEEGEALIGGTTDGVLWYCQVPNGTLRAYSFMKSKVYALDVDQRGSHALAAQTGGKTHLVNISQDDQKGKVEQVYTLKDSDAEPDATYDFGAFFASRGQRLLFGVARGSVMVWDRKSGDVVHGLNHAEDHMIQAVSCFDGSQAVDGHILTGTRQGHLTWFSQPPG